MFVILAIPRGQAHVSGPWWASLSGPVSSHWHTTLPLVLTAMLVVSCAAPSGENPAGGAMPSCVRRTSPPLCYSPQQFRTAYEIAPVLHRGITGFGRTIVIPAWNSDVMAVKPVRFTSVQASVRRYDHLFRLPNARVDLVSPFGGGLTTGDSTEAIQDVETAHMVAPGARIVVVSSSWRNRVLPTPRTTRGVVNAGARAVLALLHYVVVHNLGDVISISYVLPERCISGSILRRLHRTMVIARERGITVVAGAGDQGALGLGCFFSKRDITRGVSYPASDPLVTAVGGTRLRTGNSEGAYGSETVWNNQLDVAGQPFKYYRALNEASGGGASTVFPRPLYQGGLSQVRSGRAIPDVAIDGDPLTGLPLIWAFGSRSGGVPTGGTSIGAPAWAGIVALADQYARRRLGFLNPSLYRLGRQSGSARVFHDIRTGDNTTLVETANGKHVQVTGFDAGPGWDFVSGWGTPRVANLIPALAHDEVHLRRPRGSTRDLP
jgi:subtilase family serine protease